MSDKVILGLIEPIKVQDREIKARIDTGATSSSIDSNLAQELNLGPITRSKIVKSASGVKERPIVRIKIIIKNVEIEEEFTLADRSHMTYQMLIGQNILKKGNYLIDPSL